eukprot:scaffold375_cov175-Skeletonema_dohrnii-CCMP3373.AAC.3
MRELARDSVRTLVQHSFGTGNDLPWERASATAIPYAQHELALVSPTRPHISHDDPNLQMHYASSHLILVIVRMKCFS